VNLFTKSILGIAPACTYAYFVIVSQIPLKILEKFKMSFEQRRFI